MADTMAASSPAAAEPTLTGIQPISVKKTLMLVNGFVLSTTDFLNKFTSLCETKLRRVSQQVQRVEIVLALLEAKLDSIEWMGGGSTGGAPAASGAPAITASSSAPPAPPMDGVPAAPASASAPPAPAAEGPKLKDDPRYSKYFKMIGMGVPKQAVRLKMSADGCPDPSQIDNDPEGPAPPGGDAVPSQALVIVDTGGSDSEQSDNMSDEEGN